MLVLPIEFYMLAITCAVCRGIDPIFAKRGLESGGNWLQNTFQTLVVRTFLAWMALFIFSNGKPMVSELSIYSILIFGISGLIAAAFGSLLFYNGVDRMGASVCTAITNARPLFVVVLAVIFLGERITIGGVIGVISIVIGVILITRSKSGNVSGWKKSDLLFPLTAALLFALGNVIRRFGFIIEPISAIQALAINDIAALVGVGIYGIAIGKGKELHKGNSKSYQNFLFSGIFVFFALSALFQALLIGPVSIADPILGTAPLFTAMIAVLLLGKVEKITKIFILGTALIVLGVVLLTGS
tara:strand:+ start:78 stop:977 length:900 start_codon:yes stop_codon:yes gene_type:complete